MVRAEEVQPAALHPALVTDEPFKVFQDARSTLFITHSIDEAVPIGNTLVLLSAYPASIRELIRTAGASSGPNSS